MNIDLPVKDEASVIPAGYAAVALWSTDHVPSTLLHGTYIIPRLVKRDLHSKIKTALDDSGLAEEGTIPYILSITNCVSKSFR